MEATITIDRNNSTDTIQGSPQEHTQGNQELLLQDKVTQVLIIQHVEDVGWNQDIILVQEEHNIYPHISLEDLSDHLTEGSMEQIKDFVGMQKVQESIKKFYQTKKQVLVGLIISHLEQKLTLSLLLQ